MKTVFVASLLILSGCASTIEPSFHRMLPSGNWVINMGSYYNSRNTNQIGTYYAALQAKKIGCGVFYRDYGTPLPKQLIPYECLDGKLTPNMSHTNTDDVLSLYSSPPL